MICILYIWSTMLNGLFEYEYTITEIPTKKHIYDVIIVGSGISGITAGSELYASGYRNFLLVEATNRYGGRIYTHNLDPPGMYNTIEFGANWIHGYTKNPLFKFVNNYHIEGSVNDDLIVLKLPTQNNKVSNSKRTNVTDEFLKEKNRLLQILADIDQDKTTNTKHTDDPSLKSLLNKYHWFSHNNPLKNLVEYYVIECSMAMSPNEITGGMLKYNYFSKEKLISENNEKDQLFITDKRGFKYFVDSMIQNTLGRNFIKLNTKIVKISQKNNTVTLLTSNGTNLTARFVFITTSANVIKDNTIKFEPPLPNNFINVLNKIGMGLYTKIFIKFPCRFWHNKSFILMYDEKNSTLFRYWQHLKNSNETVCFTKDHYKFSNDNQFSILLTTLVGKDAFWIRNKSKLEVLQKVYTILGQAYGSNIPYPLDIYWYDWYGDDNFKESFPTHLKGITHNDIITLKTNIGRLFFAGDWQSEHYTGCLHGAYFSAYDRTQDLIQALHGYWDIYDVNKKNGEIVDMCLRQSDSLC